MSFCYWNLSTYRFHYCPALACKSVILSHLLIRYSNRTVTPTISKSSDYWWTTVLSFPYNYTPAIHSRKILKQPGCWVAPRQRTMLGSFSFINKPTSFVHLFCSSSSSDEVLCMYNTYTWNSLWSDMWKCDIYGFVSYNNTILTCLAALIIPVFMSCARKHEQQAAGLSFAHSLSWQHTSYLPSVVSS